MSETPPDTAPETVTMEYVSLDQHVTDQEIGVLITLTLSATEEQPVIVRIIDEFPEDAAISKARFVPEFEPMEGSIDPTGVVFEAVVSPGHATIVKYGVRVEEPDATQFSTPEIDLALPIDDLEADVSLRGSGTAAMLETIGGDRDASTASPVTVRGGGSRTHATDESTAESSPEDGEREVGIGSQADAHPVLDRLIAELQGPGVTDEQRAILRDELLVEHPKSMDVRLRYIQSQVNQFEAYADTLEEFIDRYGAPVEFAAQISSVQTELRDEIEDLTASFGAAEEERNSFRTSLDRLDESLASLEAELEGGLDAMSEEGRRRYESLRDEMQTLETDVRANEAKTEDVDFDLAVLENRVDEDLSAIRRDLDVAVDELTTSMAEDLEALADDVAETYEEAAADVASVEDRLGDRIEELHAEFRDDLEDLDRQLDALAEDMHGSVASLRDDVEKNSSSRRQFAAFIDNIRALDAETEQPDGRRKDPEIENASGGTDDDREPEFDPAGFYS